MINSEKSNHNEPMHPLPKQSMSSLYEIISNSQGQHPVLDSINQGSSDHGSEIKPLDKKEAHIGGQEDRQEQQTPKNDLDNNQIISSVKKASIIPLNYSYSINTDMDKMKE